LAKKLLAASGYSKDKPVKFTIQTTRGYKPKD
jgi:peptide/nickel transport system substrate-binding protein